MKILCTTDFSNTSINAIDFLYRMLSGIAGSHLSIIHCISVQQRSGMLLSMESLLHEKAEEDMETLKAKFQTTHNLSVVTAIYLANPKTFIINLSKKNGYDMIVTGSTGLTSLKEMTIGSVSEYFITHSEVPVLVVPPQIKYVNLDTVVIALGPNEIINIDRLQFLYQLLSSFESKISMIQVVEKGTNLVTVDPRVGDFLKDLNYEFETVKKETTISDAINQYAYQVQADLVCMIHHQKTWFQKLWHQSITKEEMYDLRSPILVIPD